MPAGRPPKPIEQKRRTGRSPGRDSGGRKLPEAGVVVALPMADGVPDCPSDFGLDAVRLWARVWQAGITWVSPTSDMEAVEQACRLADDIAVARHRYRATTDPKDGQMVVKLDTALAQALSRIGFDPAARSRLGIAEVKRVSKLEELLQRRNS